MANIRLISVTLWQQLPFVEFNTTYKMLYLYLHTCKDTNVSGIFPISLKTIENETGASLNDVQSFLKDNEELCLYDYTSRCIWVKDYIEQNKSGGHPDSLIGSIALDYSKTQNSFLWQLFWERYPQYEIIRNNHKNQEKAGISLAIISMFQGLDGKYYKIPPSNSGVKNYSPSHCALRLLIATRDNYKCKLCGSNENLTLDHIHPKSLGGTHHPNNLRCLCKSCNSHKSSKLQGVAPNAT